MIILLRHRNSCARQWIFFIELKRLGRHVGNMHDKWLAFVLLEVPLNICFELFDFYYLLSIPMLYKILQKVVRWEDASVVD